MTKTLDDFAKTIASGTTFSPSELAELVECLRAAHRSGRSLDEFAAVIVNETNPCCDCGDDYDPDYPDWVHERGLENEGWVHDRWGR
jgi:hypothetical protein